MTWAKGQSGNPGGATKARRRAQARMQRHAQKYGKDAIETLVAIMQDVECQDSARVSAAAALLDRGYGKPSQDSNLNVSFPGYKPVEVGLIRRDIDEVDAAARATNGRDPPKLNS